MYRAPNKSGVFDLVLCDLFPSGRSRSLNLYHNIQVTTNIIPIGIDTPIHTHIYLKPVLYAPYFHFQVPFVSGLVRRLVYLLIMDVQQNGGV